MRYRPETAHRARLTYRVFKPETSDPGYFTMNGNDRLTVNGSTLIHGDARDVLAALPEGSVRCVVTSPPYMGLRSYAVDPSVWGGDPVCQHVWSDHGWQGRSTPKPDRATASDGSFADRRDQPSKAGRLVPISAGASCSRCHAWLGRLGNEPNLNAYVAHLVEVFRAVRRVLSDSGTCWVVIGDSFSNDGKWGGSTGGKHATGLHGSTGIGRERKVTGLKPKDLMLVPARVALGLQADGWWLRSEIIWSKPNVLPQSVRDRPTMAHEHVFMLAKSPRYYFDAFAVREPSAQPTRGPRADRFGGNKHSATTTMHSDGSTWNGDLSTGRNMRSVLSISTVPYVGTHFAVFPPALIEPMIKAGTSERGCCPRCFKPYVRVVERQRADRGEEYMGKHAEADPQSASRRILGAVKAARASGGDHDNPFPPAVTTGWRPTCDHGLDPEPDVIVDPFCGSGTSGLVANRLGRRAILIDASAAYCDLAETRLRSGK